MLHVCAIDMCLIGVCLCLCLVFVCVYCERGCCVYVCVYVCVIGMRAISGCVIGAFCVCYWYLCMRG